jgi:hypothetical protein
LFFYIPLSAQTHNTVPLNDDAYAILEQAQLRGLIVPFPNAKPYSRAQVVRALNDMLASDKLSQVERRIAEETLVRLSPPQKQGYDFIRNAFYVERSFLNDIKFSADISLKMRETFSATFGSTRDWGNDWWLQFFLNGDIGNSFSYGVSLEGGVLREPRQRLGTYQVDYQNKTNPPTSQDAFITAYSGALTYFPFSYKKPWDNFLWYTTRVDNGGQEAWPENLAISYAAHGEVSGEAFGGALTYRMGRFDREWAGMTANNSLVLNQTARPFIALEGSFKPFNWFSISALTGVLEYYYGDEYNNSSGMKDSAEVEQSAFSIGMIEFSIPSVFSPLWKYVEFNLGSSVIWPKRFELGYIFPFIDNFLYQNNIGDFDNLALFGGMKAQFPGIGSIWGSFFLDEANPRGHFFNLDAEMYAFQAGLQVIIPWIPFTTVTASYTKVEPYCYTHRRENVPWYAGDLKVSEAYLNNGVGLGSYLPPNSDEIKVRVESVLGARLSAHLQYQMIRHGADYGSSQVDGSSLLSELHPQRSWDETLTRKFFLKDGAYEWMHIVKIGGHYSLAGSLKIPVELFGEAGVVFSQFSNTVGHASNSGEAYSYSFIDTAEYPKTIRGIVNIGMRLFW